MRPPSVPTIIPINRDDSKQIVIMKSLYNSLIEYREPKTNRILIQLFMSLPSRKDFPEYFNIIEKPIAMNKIRERIERQIYPDEDSCYEDMKLMFNNCKIFNEDGSQIFRDAKVLESILRKKREQSHLEYNRPSRDSKDATNEAILNDNSSSAASNNLSTPTSTATATTTTTTTTATTLSSTSSSSSPSTKSERLNSNNNSNDNNHVTSTATTTTTTTAATTNNTNNSSSPIKHEPNTSPNHHVNNKSTSNNNNHISNADSNSTPIKSNNITSTSNNVNNKNGVPTLNEKETLQSDSTNHSLNGNDELMDTPSIKVNHNHHNDISMDSTSNLSAELIASTPIEKCSLNTRRGRNPEAPKRQLLTGYIIYASEIRKQVIDKNPNQNFGDISRLVGNEWKALPYDIRSKYDQRALIHNKRVRERAQRELHNAVNAGGDTSRLSNGLHTPKMTKRKLAKLAKEQMRQHHLSISGIQDDSSSMSPRVNHEQLPTAASQQTPSSSYKNLHHQHSQPQTHPQVTSSKVTTADTSTQTTAIRFVEPPTKKRLVYSETFKKYIENLQVPNRELLVEETAPDRPPELPAHWLGSGIGRHESPEAALWALRDFMLQDAVTMRRSMEPYL